MAKKKLTKAEQQKASDTVRRLNEIIKEYRQDGRFQNFTPNEIIKEYSELESIISNLSPELLQELDS